MREDWQKQASSQSSLSTQGDTAALSKWDYSHQQLISPVTRARVITSAWQTRDLRQAKCSYTSGGSSVANLCPGSLGFTLNGAKNGQGRPSEPGSDSHRVKKETGRGSALQGSWLCITNSTAVPTTPCITTVLPLVPLARVSSGSQLTVPARLAGKADLTLHQAGPQTYCLEIRVMMDA